MGQRTNGLLQGHQFVGQLGLDTFHTIQGHSWQVPQDLEIVTELSSPQKKIACDAPHLAGECLSVRPRNQMGKLEKKKILERLGNTEMKAACRQKGSNM